MSKPTIPQSGEEELTSELARTMIFVLIITFALLSAVIALMAFTGQSPSGIRFLSISAVFTAITIALAYRGIMLPGRLLIAACIIFVVTTISFAGYGLHDIAMFGIPITLLIGGMLAGRRSLWLVTSLCLASVVFIGYADMAGWSDSPLASKTSWDDVAVICIMIISAAVILRFTMERMNLNVQEARKHAQAFHDSESRFRAFMETSPAIVIMKDADGRYVYCNSKVEMLFGLRTEEIIGKTEFDLFPREDAQKFVESDQLVLRTGKPLMSEYPASIPSGEMRDWWVFKFLLTDSTGNKYVGIQIMDITARKKVEADLAFERDVLQALMQSVPDTVYFKDTESRFTRINEKQAQFLGAESTKDAIGKSDFDYQPYHLAKGFYEEEQELIKTGRSIRDRVEYNPTREGKPRWVSASKAPLRDTNDQIVGIVGISRDITERKLAELERERLIGDLENRNAELERFTYTVSHDLRSPLVTIDGFLGYVERNAGTGNMDKVHDDIQRIKAAVKKMQSLLKDLLELSRIGRMMNDPETIPFNDLARSALENVAGQLKNCKAEVNLEDIPDVVHGDRTRLIEVLQNLLDNACKYMGSQPAPCITIGRRSSESGAPVFFVYDNGMGIEPRYHNTVFGLFNKLDSASEGTGIGLALTKRIIEIHKGRIWVESEGQGKGSTFCFTLASNE